MLRVLCNVLIGFFIAAAMWWLLGDPWWMPVGAGIVALGASMWMNLPPTRAGRVEADITASLDKGDALVEEMGDIIINSYNVATEVNRIQALASEIMRKLRGDRSLIPTCSRFLGYYLEATVDIIRRYKITASKLPPGDKRRTELENNFLNTLMTVRILYARQLERFTEDDMADMNTHIAVFNQMLQSESQ